MMHLSHSVYLELVAAYTRRAGTFEILLPTSFCHMTDGQFRNADEMKIFKIP